MFFFNVVFRLGLKFCLSDLLNKAFYLKVNIDYPSETPILIRKHPLKK